MSNQTRLFILVFLAFLPTAFRGVSELGLITAGGMVSIVILTLVLFPLTLSRVLTGPRLAALRSRPPVAVRFPAPGAPRVVVEAGRVVDEAGPPASCDPALLPHPGGRFTSGFHAPLRPVDTGAARTRT